MLARLRLCMQKRKVRRGARARDGARAGARAGAKARARAGAGARGLGPGLGPGLGSAHRGGAHQRFVFKVAQEDNHGVDARAYEELDPHPDI